MDENWMGIGFGWGAIGGHGARVVARRSRPKRAGAQMIVSKSCQAYGGENRTKHTVCVVQLGIGWDGSGHMVRTKHD